MNTKTIALGLCALFAAGATFAGNPEEAMNKAGCMACHAKDKKVIGPAFKDVAAKYKGQNVSAQLMEKVRKGGSGVWGPIPMAPNPPDKINDGDLKEALEFILKTS